AMSHLSDPIPLPFDNNSLAAYRSALAWLLDYTAADIPAPSSILEIFWSAQASLSDRFLQGIVLRNFRSVLAFPVWLFNANNYGNTELQGKRLNEGLPDEFYTRAEVVRPLVKLKFEARLLI